MSLLSVEGLKTYYTTMEGTVKAVDGVSFQVREGEVLGLAGESGCGKTTVALSIMKLLPPNGRIVDGRILFRGEDLVRKDRLEMKKIRWKRISMIFQGAMNALNPVLRIEEQITEAILTHENVSRAEARRRAEKLFSLVGLDPSRIRDYPHEFSGGMKQRVMIAMALACNPDLVIADEPTTALDVVVKGQILTLINDLKERLNLSMIIITHDLSAIYEVCDRVAVMYAGKLVEVCDRSSFFHKPLHPYSRGLLQAFPSIRGHSERLSPIPGSPPDLINPPTGCRFHPRCPEAQPICRKEEPPMVQVGEGWMVACHLYA